MNNDQNNPQYRILEDDKRQYLLTRWNDFNDIDAFKLKLSFFVTPEVDFDTTQEEIELEHSFVSKDKRDAAFNMTIEQCIENTRPYI